MPRSPRFASRMSGVLFCSTLLYFCCISAKRCRAASRLLLETGTDARTATYPLLPVAVVGGGAGFLGARAAGALGAAGLVLTALLVGVIRAITTGFWAEFGELTTTGP